jgi:putative transposase
MYRIARDAGQSRERRTQASHPPRVRPELVAHGPSQVWSWDITAVKGPQKGQWYKLWVYCCFRGSGFMVVRVGVGRVRLG